MNQLDCGQYKVSNNWYAGVGLFFFTLLIFLSPLVNLVDYVGVPIPIFFYSFLAISGIIAALPILVGRDYLPAVLATGILIGFFIFGYPAKGAGAALVFYVAYKGIQQSKLIILRALYTLLIINYLIILLQLSGVFEIAYSFANYANVAVPISFLEADTVTVSFLPQIRPSGIFPAPTYINFFCITLYFIASFFRKEINKLFMTLIGSFFVLTGSTMGLVLILLLAMNVFRDKVVIWALLGYAFTLHIYFALIPEIAAYNYSVADFSASVLNRVMDESIIILNPELLAVLVLIFALAVLYIGVRFGVRLLSTIPIVAVIFAPMLLHEAYSLLNFFMLGVGVGSLSLLVSDLTFPRKIEKYGK